MNKGLLKKLQLSILSLAAVGLLAACGPNNTDEDPAVEDPAVEDPAVEDPAGETGEETP